MEKTHRDAAIDLLRGFAVIMMVAGHIGFGTFCNNWIHAFHIPLFFFVSGLVFNPEKYQSFFNLLVKQIRRLMVPYVVVACFHYVIQIIIEWYGGGK